MGSIAGTDFNLFLLGFAFQGDEFLILAFFPFCDPIQHIQFLCDFSQPSNTLARSVNTQALNSLPYIVLFQQNKKDKKNFSGKLLCSYGFFAPARNGVNQGGTTPVRLQAPSYKGCTAVPPVPAFLKLFFQKIFFWEKYYIEARFLHPAP
jgi:hypothetical protein